eukprot:SAG31_NODE_4918_length_2868_cov_1.461177_1_plen_688_part_10
MLSELSQGSPHDDTRTTSTPVHTARDGRADPCHASQKSPGILTAEWFHSARALHAVVQLQRRYRRRSQKRRHAEQTRDLRRSIANQRIQMHLSSDEQLLLLKQKAADHNIAAPGSPWRTTRSDRRFCPARNKPKPHQRPHERVLLLAPMNFKQWQAVRETLPGAVKGVRRLWHCQLHPFEPSRKFWDTVMLLAVVYTVFVGSFTAVFSGTDSFVGPPQIILDVLFWFDILLNFVTGYVNAEHVVTFGFRRIARNYVCGWFVLDIIATAPWRDVARLMDSGVSDPMQRLLQLCGMLRVSRAPRLMTRMQQQSTLALHSEIASFLRFSFYAAAVAHLLACSFFLLPALVTDVCALEVLHQGVSGQSQNYSLGSNNDNNSSKQNLIIVPDNFDCTPANSWRDTNGLWHSFEGGRSSLDQYFMSIYWSVTTMTSIGYGDITPVSAAEVKFVVVAQLVGMCFFALLIDRITRVSSVLEENRAHNIRKDAIISFMRQHNVDADFQSKVISFLNFAAPSHQSKSFDDNDARFETLSPALKRELRHKILAPVLRGVHVLEDEALVPTPFIEALAQKMETGSFVPGEQIVRPGNYGNSLHIVTTGQAVVQRDGISNSLIIAKSQQNYFGLTAALIDNQNFEMVRLRSAGWSVNAISYCDVAAIEHDDFVLTLLQTWPTGEQQMRRNALAEVLRVEGA